MYVDDAAATLADFARVLRPGGLAHAIEGDWYALVAEPVEHGLWRRFVQAAGYACRTADMGRKLPAAFRAAGFGDIEVSVRSLADTGGAQMGMIRNMARYAGASGAIPPEEAADVVSQMEATLASGGYLFTSSQFIVTGVNRAA